MAKRASLLGADELFKFRFGEDSDAEFLGFVIFGAGVRADDDIVGLLANRTTQLAAMLLDKFARFLAAAAFQCAGEDERFASELLTLDFTLLGRRADSRGMQ